MRVATRDPLVSPPRPPRRVRRPLTFASVLALCLGVLVGVAGGSPANAAQATGEEVAAWNTGWSWTYATSFRYQAEGTDVTINENLVYTVAGVETFAGQEAYKLNISGNITGGSGSVAVPSVGNASLSGFSGSVTGTRFVRTSDLAVLQETQKQNLNATAKVSIISQGITAVINLKLDPSPSWKTHDFPLNAGDTWQMNQEITYEGGFSYDAGSLGGTGADTFEGVLPFQAPVSVVNENITQNGIGTVATKKISAASADGQTSNNIWWSQAHKNDARDVLVLPLDGAKLTMTKNLSSASTPSAGTTVSATATPSLTCAGGTVTVAGTLSSFAAGVPVNVALDKSQINPGQRVTATTTTGAGGAYSATITVPSESDQLSKNGSRANWGVTVTAGAARAATSVVVTHQNCTSLTYTGDTGAQHGTNATVKAKLTDLTGASAAGRQITFALSGGGTVSATTDAAGVATAQLPVGLPVRNATVSASFAGTSTLVAATASSPFAVDKITTTTTVTPSESPATHGENVSFTAYVNGAGQPSGSVQFAIDGANFGAPVGLSGGQATSAAIDSLGLGNHTVTATYLGSAEHAGSDSGAVTFLVRPPLLVTTTTSSATPSAVHYGQQVVLGAVVSSTAGGVPTGQVTFTSGGTVLGTVGLDGSGEASLALDDLAAGTHNVVATYSGDDVYRASSANPRTVTVTKAGTEVTLTSSSPSTVSGEAVTFTADVAVLSPGVGTPVGTVQLRIDGANVGSPVTLVGGTAVFPAVGSLLAGGHTVTAVYAGTGNFDGSQASVQQQVAQADTTTTVLVSPSPSAEGQNITITAAVTPVAPGSGTPTGLVSFTANGDLIGATSVQPSPGGAQATMALADLEAGDHQIVATYVGDAGYATSVSQQVQHTVIAGAAIVPTTTVVTSSANPSTFGELISFSAQVEAEDGTVPTGMIRFSVDGAPLGGQVVLDGNGRAESTTIASPDPGDHTVIAAFVPDAGYGGSGDILAQTVAAATVSLDLTSSDDSSDHGQAVRFTATIASEQAGTGAPTGFIQFEVDGQPLGDAIEIEDGEAQSPAISSLSPGDHLVTAVYSGDAHFAPTLTSLTQQVAKVGTSTALTASKTSTTYGDQVTFTAKVTPAAGGLGAPTGTVKFMDGATTLATVAVAAGPGNTGTASYSTADLGAGSHNVKAVYSGSDAFAGSTSGQVGVSVAKRATSLTADAAVVKLLPLGLPLGSLRVTLRSGSTPLAGLPLQFKIGNTVVCTLNTDAAGVAICNAAPQLVTLILSGGYKVSFAGDANHLASNANGVLLK